MTLEEYEKSGHKAYAQLASTISAILSASISRQPHIRLQQLQARGKDPASLGKKLIHRGLENPPDLAIAVKDLAGCRAIFYTNTDVKAFEQSGIITGNFEIDWDRTKRHHPLSPDDPPFISTNWVIRLKDDRTALPEYADLAGLWCELQIHTTLNHAWSEMEHDMVYKMPKVEGFGGRAMAQVQDRLNAIMRRHLIPAGHEFSMVIHDFNRLRQGRDLFDRNALEAIAAAGDNNDRLNLIDRFASHVLPNYDDVQAVWPEIRSTLLSAVDAARATEPVEIETGFELMPGASADRVEARIAAVFKDLRYIDVERTLDDALDRYASAPTDAAREQWVGVLKALSENNIELWRHSGPTLQLRVVQHLAKLEPSRREALRTPLLTVLGAVLKPSASGAFLVAPDTVSVEEAALPASDALQRLRAEALGMLMALFEAADSDPDRRAIVAIFNAATRAPTSFRYAEEAHAGLVRDAVRVIDFYSRSLGDLSFDLRQQIEHDLLQLHYRYRSLSETTGPAVRAEVPALMAAIIAFKDALNADPDFVIYKTLVGFRSVFPDAWVGQPFDHRRDQVHREAMVATYVDEVNADTVPAWLPRLQRIAATGSRNGATFPMFAAFLARLGAQKPDVVLSFIGGLDEPLARFSPALLQGLAKAGRRAEIDALLDRWIAEKRFIAEVLRYLRFADKVAPMQIRAAFAVACEVEDAGAIADAALAALRQRTLDPELVSEVSLPAFATLSTAGRFEWISELSALDHEKDLEGAFQDEDRRAVLGLIAAAPALDYDEETVLEVLTRNDRTALLDVFQARFDREEAEERADDRRFEAVPFHFQHLAQIPEAEALAAPLVERAYGWFLSDPGLFKYRGGRVVTRFYPGLSEPLQAAILSFVDRGADRGAEYAAHLLRAYSGETFPLEVARQLVARLPAGAEALEEIDIALSETGVVEGAFGFVEAYQAKLAAVEPWLRDELEPVRAFAKRFRHRLYQSIVAEQQRAEESEALRRMAFAPVHPPDEATKTPPAQS